MSDGTLSCKFWTLQKKIYALAVTVIAVGASWVAVTAGGDKINDSIDSRITCRAVRVADSCDSVRASGRFPIDSMILSELKGIRMENRKSAFIREKTTNRTNWEKAEAAWRSDSLFNARYPTK